MENLDQATGFATFKKNVPKANGSFVLGIVAIVVDIVLCCCYGYIISLILSIIGLILGLTARKTYELSPGDYSEESYNKAKTGITLNIVALILSILTTIVMFTFYYLALTGQLPPEIQDAFDEGMKKYK